MITHFGHLLELVLIAELAVGCTPASSRPQKDEAVLAHVDPMIGTGRTTDGGQTWPGVSRPNGMLYWNPDPLYDVSSRYENPITRGLGLTHLNGVGCTIYGDVPIMPIAGEIGRSPALYYTDPEPGPYVATFRHANEHAVVGGYDVTLDNGVTVGLSASVRSGIGTFGFPAGQKGTLLFDAGRNLSSVIDAEVNIAATEVSGWVMGSGMCNANSRYKLFFTAQFDRRPEQFGTYDIRGVTPNAQKVRTGASGGGAYVTFGTGASVKLKVGLSYVSVEKARANLLAEVGDKSPNQLRAETRVAWADYLARAEVKGGSINDTRTFYTALYHTFLGPNIFSDFDGEYIGFDGVVHRIDPGHAKYANISGWDIYRSQTQLLAILAPELASDIGRSILTDSDQGGGGLPVWPIANTETNIMGGDPGTLILANFWNFGARGFDGRKALAAMLRNAFEPDNRMGAYPARLFLKSYIANGYTRYKPRYEQPNYGEVWNPHAALTLEYNSADFAASRMAEALGDRKSALKLRDRSGSWRTIFDPGLKYIHPRDESGKFDPSATATSTAGFVEGTSAQYTWQVLHDIGGLTQAIGGNAEAVSRLDQYFSVLDKPLQVAGVLGTLDSYKQPTFNIQNEPSFSHPWLYNWVGQPWKTQEAVRKTLAKYFNDQPDGLPGNDDVGATSAWVVFAQLGLFPAIPGEGGLTFNTPTFPKVTLQIKGRPLTIATVGKGHYIKSVAVDGRNLTRSWLGWPDMAKASRITFALTDSIGNAARLGPPPSFPGK